MEIFMTLVGIFLLVQFGFLVVDRFPVLKSLFKADIDYPHIFTKRFWLECSKSRQIKKRLLFTIVMVVVYKLGYLIPLPGIDISAIAEIQARINSESSGSIFKVMNQFSGGIVDKANIFTLGLMPYLSACLLLQVVGVIIRPLRKHFFSGQFGREKVVRYSLGLSLLLCAVQAYFLTLWLENPNVFMGISIVHNPGWMFRIIGTFTMVTGLCLILWLANLITYKGIGQGVAILVFSDVVAGLVSSIQFTAFGLNETPVQPSFYIICFFLFIVLVLVSVIATVWKKDVPISIKGKETNIPIRFTWVARQPTSWAQGFVLLPATIASFSTNAQWQEFAGNLTRGGAPYYISYAVLIMLFAYAYKAVVFKAGHATSLIKKYESEIAGAKTNEEMTNIFQATTNKVAFLIGLFLLTLAVFPDSIMAFFQVPYMVASIFGGASLLIVVGVLYDIQEQIQAKLEMENTDSQITCDIAFDEIEATIKKGFLETNGIKCVVEPLRFTWGLPIRTAVDEYRLNVSESNSKTAKDLLT